LKASGHLDLGLLVCDTPAAAAGAFTTNAFPAAPVMLTRAQLASGTARAIVVNSGQANAGTGEPGLDDAKHMAHSTATALGFDAEDVLVCSTGVIGPRIPLDRFDSGLGTAVDALSDDDGHAFAEAICTTDAGIKVATADAGPFRVGGCAKGAGMIAPRLATLLTFITTDAPVSSDALDRLVREHVVPVWNGVTIDDCQSTNDTVLVLASGAVEAEVDEAQLGAALLAVAEELARQLAASAEGATKTLVVQVDGAADQDAARQVGLAVAGSDLVKSAVFGGDPNPGRILQGAGDAGVPLDPFTFGATIGDVPVIDRGVVLEVGSDAKRALEGPEVVIAVQLGMGSESATVFGCDLSYDYVRINAEYST
jgi:glutamate N-acetyltransferase/amino-acid N-acetyltransferase